MAHKKSVTCNSLCKTKGQKKHKKQNDKANRKLRKAYFAPLKNGVKTLLSFIAGIFYHETFGILRLLSKKMPSGIASNVLIGYIACLVTSLMTGLAGLVMASVKYKKLQQTDNEDTLAEARTVQRSSDARAAIVIKQCIEAYEKDSIIRDEYAREINETKLKHPLYYDSSYASALIAESAVSIAHLHIFFLYALPHFALSNITLGVIITVVCLLMAIRCILSTMDQQTQKKKDAKEGSMHTTLAFAATRNIAKEELQDFLMNPRKFDKYLVRNKFSSEEDLLLITIKKQLSLSKLEKLRHHLAKLSLMNYKKQSNILWLAIAWCLFIMFELSTQHIMIFGAQTTATLLLQINIGLVIVAIIMAITLSIVAYSRYKNHTPRTVLLKAMVLNNNTDIKGASLNTYLEIELLNSRHISKLAHNKSDTQDLVKLYSCLMVYQKAAILYNLSMIDIDIRKQDNKVLRYATIATLMAVTILNAAWVIYSNIVSVLHFMHLIVVNTLSMALIAIFVSMAFIVHNQCISIYKNTETDLAKNILILHIISTSGYSALKSKSLVGESFEHIALVDDLLSFDSYWHTCKKYGYNTSIVAQDQYLQLSRYEQCNLKFAVYKSTLDKAKTKLQLIDDIIFACSLFFVYQLRASNSLFCDQLQYLCISALVGAIFCIYMAIKLATYFSDINKAGSLLQEQSKAIANHECVGEIMYSIDKHCKILPSYQCDYNSTPCTKLSNNESSQDCGEECQIT